MKNDFRENRIVLMIKNPHWAYSYWEIKQSPSTTYCISRTNFGNRGKKILRVYKIEKEAGFFTFSKDEEVHGECREWYFHLGEKEVQFFIEIGLKEENGRFLPLARSNYVTTASDEVSKNREEKWVMPDVDGSLKEIRSSNPIKNRQMNQNKVISIQNILNFENRLPSLIKRQMDNYPLSSNSSENLFLNKK